MSWSKTITIWCDGQVQDETGLHGCAAWIYGPDGEGVYAARRHARDKGWTHGALGDLCPGPHVSAVPGSSGEVQG